MLANAYLDFKKEVFQLLFQANGAELPTNPCEPAFYMRVNSLCYTLNQRTKFSPPRGTGMQSPPPRSFESIPPKQEFSEKRFDRAVRTREESQQKDR